MSRRANSPVKVGSDYLSGQICLYIVILYRKKKKHHVSLPRKDTQTLQKVLNWNLFAASSKVLALAESIIREPV